MRDTQARFTLPQAAALTGLPLSAVHKAVEMKIVRPSKRGQVRWLSTPQLLYLQLEAGGLRSLPIAQRRQIAQSLQRRPTADALAIAGNEVLVVEVRPARTRLHRALRQWNHIARHVVSDPAIMRGHPVFKGTRIPVRAIADMLRQGASVDELVEGYPALTRELISLAPLYVLARPSRGRPVTAVA